MEWHRHHVPTRLSSLRQHRIALAAIAALLLAFLGGSQAGGAPAPSIQDDTATSDVAIVVWSCPAGTDIATVIFDTCANATSGVTFTLSGGPLEFTWTTGPLEQSGTAIEGLAPGTYSLTQTPSVAGARSLHWRCGALGASGSAAGASSGEGKTLDLTTEAGTDYRCDWYSIPAAGTPVATPIDAAGTVNVVAHLCPAGTDPSSTVDQLLEQCNAPPPDDLTISVTITDNPPTMASGKGRSIDDQGVAEFAFTELPLGPIIILETIPEGYGDPNAFCSDTGTGITSLGEPTSWTERVQWVLRADAGAPLTCHFFNFPIADQGNATPAAATTQTSMVRLVAYTCPAEFERDDVRHLDGADCHAGYDNPIAFTISDGAAYTRTQETTYDPSGTIHTEFTDVPFGTISISQSDPGGFGPPAVLCSDTYSGTIPDFYDPVPVADDGTVTVDLRADAEEPLTCLFYNFPIENTVRIAAYLCPLDVDRSGNDGLLAYDCQQEFDEPLVFTVKDDATFSTSTTATADNSNVLHAELTDVPLGTVSITESVPDGFGEPIVFCSDTHSGDPGLYDSVAVMDGGTVTWELRADADEPLTCLFFNFQDDYADPSPGVGTIHVAAYACPATAERSGNVEALLDHCLDLIAPVRFSVGDYATWSETQLASAEVPSSIAFTGVPAGKVYVMEWVPDGYGEPLAFCTSDPARAAGSFSPVQLSSSEGDIADADLTFALRADTQVSCVFFNFPQDGA